MKKYFGIVFAVLFASLIVLSASAATVFVNDGGTGDGSSATSPFGTMDAAINAVAAGGTVQIVDTYTCADEYKEPAHTGEITITGGKYVFDNGNYNRYFINGPVTFENIELVYNQGKTSLFVGNFNKLVMGEGIIAPDRSMYVVGGYQVPFAEDIAFDKTSDVTIKSGTYHLVAGGCRGKGENVFTGMFNVTIEGGDIASVYGSSVNGNISTNATVNVKGGSIDTLYTAGDATRRLEGDCIVNVTGGSIGSLTLNNVMGKATINFNGGTIGSALKLGADPAIADNVREGKYVLAAANEGIAKRIALSFDEVTYADGSAPVTTAATSAATEAATEKTTTEAGETTVADTSETVSGETSADTSAPDESVAASAETSADATKAEDETTAPAATDVTENAGVPVWVWVVIAIAVVAVVVVIIVVAKKKK